MIKENHHFFHLNMHRNPCSLNWHYKILNYLTYIVHIKAVLNKLLMVSFKNYLVIPSKQLLIFTAQRLIKVWLNVSKVYCEKPLQVLFHVEDCREF